MRVRVRGPNGQSTLTLEATATVAELSALITEQTGLGSFDVKYGYPQPQPFDLSRYDPSQKLTDIDVKLNGEQLIVNSKETPAPSSGADDATIIHKATSPAIEHKNTSTTTKADDDSEAPEVPSAEHAGTVVLRIMPDDNSCLFRAVGSAVVGGMDTMTELRSIIAQTIQAQPEEYPDVVLERKADDYCRWIQSEDAWGGAIELNILSKHFGVEICSIDVQTLRVDRFNEGQATRCFVVYSGIHYDAIALSPSDPPFTHAYAPPDFDTRVFDAHDPVILEKALDLCRILQKKHYYTDTATFRIKCNTCGGLFVGEKGATEHATKTGHYDFGEAG